jgi:hypothetical protein
MTENMGDFAADVDNDPALVSRASALAEAEGISVLAAITKLAEAAGAAAKYHDRPPVRLEWEHRRRAAEPCDGHHLADDCPCGRGWSCTCTCRLDNDVSLYKKPS